MRYGKFALRGIFEFGKLNVAIGFAGILLALTNAASAQNIVTFDEAGNATYNGASVPVDVIVSGGGEVVLPTVFAPVSTLLVPGDILITEPGTGNPSDLLRFENDDRQAGGQTGVILVYSDLEPGEVTSDIADVPQLPSTTTSFIFPEEGPDGTPASYSETGTNGLFAYTPADGTPGADLSGASTITYNFYSDIAVPEPASIVVLASLSCLGLSGRGFSKRRKA